MSISVAKSAGFCHGVRHAVEKALEVSKRSDVDIYCLGDIIHNNDVIRELREKGIKTVDSVEDITQEGAVVLIRAHGIGKEVYNRLKSKNVEIVDATCVYVKRIHTLVEQKHEEGRKIIIIGDRMHPEVIGINGWCDDTAYIIADEADLENIPYGSDDPVAVFSQTTFEKNKYRKIIDKIKISFKNLQEFDTICKSTLKRQEEAEELSKKCDIMIVLGGERSSNTKKIYDICKTNCEETYLAENLSKLPRDLKLKNKKAGITAGASTPANVIREVYKHMNESVSKEKDLSFEDAINQASLRLSSGSVVKGKVIGRTDEELYIDVSYKSDGVLPKEEFGDEEEFAALKAGDEIEVYVTRVNDNEGYVLLSKKRVDSIRSADAVKRAFEEKTPLKAKVRNAVKGGVIAEHKGFEIFVPASQISDAYIRDLSSVVGNTIDVLITEFDLRKKRVIGSARVIIEKEKEENLGRLWDEIEVGKEYEGTIKSFVDFGAFVNIGPIDGLLHISEMSWSQIKHPSDIFKVGEKIKVTILSYDEDKKKVSLGYRREEDNPWYMISEEIKAGDEIDVRIVRIVPFGAFAEIKPGVEGLIHISNISHKRLGHPAEVLRIDEIVRVKVLEVDESNKRVALSIKELLAPDAEPEDISKEEEDQSSHSEELDVSLGDVIDFNISK